MIFIIGQLSHYSVIIFTPEMSLDIQELLRFMVLSALY